MTRPEHQETSDKIPSVLILVLGSFPEQALALILWGIEEEGIPFEIRQAVEGSAQDLARQAAFASILNVGIGINGQEGKAALYHRDLGEKGPLFSLDLSELFQLRLRYLGANAARLVKGNPLLFESGTENPGLNKGDMNHLASSLDQEELTEIVYRIVTELLSREPGSR